MKLHKFICPHCNGTLDIEIAKGISSVFCPYCGQKFLLDDEKKEYTINKNINIDKTIHKRYTDDAEVIKAKLKDDEEKRSWMALFICMVICFAIPFGVLAKFELDEYFANKEGKISAGYYQDLIGKDYKIVEAHFEAAGFSNIELINLDDTGIVFWDNGKVEVISVGGDTNFESTDWFDPNTKVVISYH